MRDKEPATRIIYVRHGETDFPVDRIYCDDREDPELNEAGVAQAESAADSLIGCSFSAVYTSPMARTQATARLLLKQRPDVPLFVESMLRERRFGEWEGLTFAQIESEYSELYRAWKRDQAGFKPEGGESIYDVQLRIDTLVGQLIERHRGEAVVVVAHVGPIRAAIASAAGMSMSDYRRIQVDPASISVIDYGKRQNNLMLLNFSKRFFAEKASDVGTY